MLAFGRFLQQQAQGEPDDGQYDVFVEQMVQRVLESVLLEDRRQALQQLRDLLAGSSQAQLAFGAVGLPAMLQVVRDREDLEMMQLALESLAAAIGGSSDTGAAQAVAINAQQLARTPEALPLLLSLLEQGSTGASDFYARYHALQVLKGLAAAAPRQLQEAILGAPLGMTRIMDLLGEQEVLRNEALLLLTQLAEGSSDLQKIAAFEGAFDRLFGIIKEEGMLDGDIVVQDSFQLLAALLRGSPSNQLMFRETGFLAQLPAILRVTEGSNPAEVGHAEISPQKAANLVAALEVVLALLPPPAADPATPICSSQAENRQALQQRGVLDVLVGLALQGGGLPDDAVRAQALLCLGALITGSLLLQDQLAALSMKSVTGEPVPLLQAVLQAAVAAPTAAEQVAADRLLEAYCCGNAAGQSVLAGSLMHGAAAAPSSFGGVLLSSLGRHGSFSELAVSSRAAAALSHLVSGNPGIRPHLLTLQVQIQASQQQRPATPGGSSASSLMTVLASHLGLLLTQHGRQPASMRAAAGTLRLLLLWLHACPPAVTAFLRAVAQSQPFLVDSIRGSNACSGCASSSNPLTCGMLALLLGLCASYTEDAAGTPTQQQLHGAIDKQIGQQQFLNVLDGLQQHVANPEGSSSGTIFNEGPSISPSFAAFLTAIAAEVRQRVTGSASAAPPSSAMQPQSMLPKPASNAAARSSLMPHIAAAPTNGSTAAWLQSKDNGASTSPRGVWQPTGANPPTSTAGPRTYQPVSLPLANASTPAAMPNNHMAVTTPHSGMADGTTQLQEAAGTAEALLRENQQLRAELVSLTERLRQTSNTNHGPTPQAAVDAQAAAEAQADALRQQLTVVQQHLAHVQADAERAHGDAAASQAAARKLEADLEDLSAAYSTLDAHAGRLQQQVEQLQRDLAASQQRQQQDGAQTVAQGGVGEAELQQRLEAVRQESQQEADDAMADLLVCLGQEEAKVARLRERLEAYGVDCEALLADIVAAGGEQEDIT